MPRRPADFCRTFSSLALKKPAHPHFTLSLKCILLWPAIFQVQIRMRKFSFSAASNTTLALIGTWTFFQRISAIPPCYSRSQPPTLTMTWPQSELTGYLLIFLFKKITFKDLKITEILYIVIVWSFIAEKWKDMNYQVLHNYFFAWRHT